MKKLLMIGIALSLGIALTGCGSSEKLKLEKTYTVELGEKVSTDPNMYLKDADKDIVKDTVISFDKSKVYTVDSKQKALVPVTGTYLPIGKYLASAKYKDESKKFTVEVKDTTAPKFVDFKKELIIEANAQDVDLTKYYKAEDLSMAEITVDKAKLDISKVGSYEINVTATDKYKNKITKKVIVNIVSMEVAEKDGVTSTIEGIKPQSKALEEKIALAKQQEEERRQKENEQQVIPQTNTQSTPENNGTQPSNEVASPTGNAVANAAKSFVGNGGFFLGEWSCINTVDSALTAAGVDPAPMRNVYDNFGNGGYEVSSLQVGDVVMYYSTLGVYHCAVYIGNGLAVHGGYNPTPNENGYLQVTVQIDSYNAGADSGVKFFRFW